MLKKPLMVLLSLCLTVSGCYRSTSSVNHNASTVNMTYHDDDKEANSDPITINDNLEEEAKCTEKDSSQEDEAHMKLFVKHHNNNFSTKEYSWFFKPNSKGLPPEEPPEVIRMLNSHGGYYLGNPEQKELYLTFDEGYENGFTEKILDVLKKHEIKAAFFVVEPYVKRNWDLIKRMVEEGHLVCNHSAHHPSMAKITDIEKFKRELDEVEAEFKAATGKDMPKYFRPPMGRYSELSLHYTKELGYKSVFWSLAYYDWDPKKQPNPVEAKNLLLKRTHSGSIVLLHAVSKTNAEILDDLLTSWKDQGYSFKTLDQLPER